MYGAAVPATGGWQPSDVQPDSTPKEMWKKGEVPYLFQIDPQWAEAPYAGSTVGEAGCGPTALTMAYIALTGAKDYDPPQNGPVQRGQRFSGRRPHHLDVHDRGGAKAGAQVEGAAGGCGPGGPRGGGRASGHSHAGAGGLHVYRAFCGGGRHRQRRQLGDSRPQFPRALFPFVGPSAGAWPVPQLVGNFARWMVLAIGCKFFEQWETADASGRPPCYPLKASCINTLQTLKNVQRGSLFGNALEHSFF